MVHEAQSRLAHAAMCLLGSAVVAGAVFLPAEASQRRVASGDARGATARLAANRSFLYVADPGSNAVAILDSRYRLMRSITQGVNVPAGEWFDKHGNLYLANEGSSCSGGNVVEYPPGATAPRFTYSAGLTCPTTVTTDSRGHVYVYDFGYFINVYKHGRNAVLRRLKLPPPPFHCLYSWGGGLIADHEGNVFVTISAGCNHVASHWSYTAIFEYVGGKGGPVYLNEGEGLTSPGLALDRSGNLIMTSSGGGLVECAGSISVYPRPYTGSSTIFAYGNPSGPLCQPINLALSPDQSMLFVTNSPSQGSQTNILVYSYPGGQLLTTLGTANGLSAPYGLAVGLRR